jgi:hypothetical protein
MALPQPFRDLGTLLGSHGVNVPGWNLNRTDMCLQASLQMFDDLLTHEVSCVVGRGRMRRCSVRPQ